MTDTITPATRGGRDQDFLAPAARLRGAGIGGLEELSDIERSERLSRMREGTLGSIHHQYVPDLRARQERIVEGQDGPARHAEDVRDPGVLQSAYQRLSTCHHLAVLSRVCAASSHSPALLPVRAQRLIRSS